MKSLSIITTDKYDVSFRSDSDKKFVDIPFDELKGKVSDIVAGIGEIFEDSAAKLRSYELNEITLSLEISASGKVGILGSGVESSGTGAIELVFRKKENS